jgi:hypothetical protein
MIEGTPLSQLAQQLIAERQTHRDFVADTRRLIPHQAGASVLIELEHNAGTTAVTPTRFALGQIAGHYKIPMAYVDRMTQAGAGALLAKNLAYWFAEQPGRRGASTRRVGPRCPHSLHRSLHRIGQKRPAISIGFRSPMRKNGQYYQGLLRSRGQWRGR